MSLLPKLVSFGEALTDMIRQPDRTWLALPGGAPWNLARITSRLGTPTGFAGACSNDVFGEELFAMSQYAKLDERFLQRVGRSSLLAIVTPDTRAQYFFVGHNSADLAFDPDALPTGWLAAAELVHFGRISLARQPLATKLLEIAMNAWKAGRRISFDPNYRQPRAEPAYAKTLRAMVELSNYIKVSAEDLEGLFPALSRDVALAQLRTLAPAAALLLTDGSAGMTLMLPGDQMSQRAMRVKLGDTIGCGDAAMGGWLTSLITAPERSSAEHVLYTPACAAVCATQRGAYAPTPAEVELMLMRDSDFTEQYRQR